jgi:hypothetical protein
LGPLVGGQCLGQAADGLVQITFAQFVVFDVGRGATPDRIAAVLAVTLLPFSVVGPLAGVWIATGSNSPATAWPWRPPGWPRSPGRSPPRRYSARLLVPAAFLQAAAAAYVSGLFPSLAVLATCVGVVVFAFQVLKISVDALVGGAAPDAVRGCSPSTTCCTTWRSSSPGWPWCRCGG